jgi:asparagine synthase (glutamine-hydrolysing)
MLMAHSVEGRFPFLDADVVEVANRLPARFKLRGLDEKHVLKRAAVGLVPESVLRRPKQPYRAPDALAFAGEAAPAWADEVASEHAVREAGVFDPGVVARLWRKCRLAAGTEQFSNADNMAVVGVLSTGLLHEALVKRRPEPSLALKFTTVIDRLAGRVDGARAPEAGEGAR